MFKTKHKNPDHDDMLVAIRRDGNVIIDREIRQELGMILSDKYNMAIRNDELVSFVEWLRADSPPVGKGNSFFLADEPKHPTEDATVMNRVLPALYNKAALGKAQLQVAAAKRKQVMKSMLVGAVAFAFITVFGIIPICKPPELVSLPDSVVEQIIEQQEERKSAELENDIRRLYDAQQALEREKEGLPPEQPTTIPIPEAEGGP